LVDRYIAFASASILNFFVQNVSVYMKYKR